MALFDSNRKVISKIQVLNNLLESDKLPETL